nr:FeoB-associated Cys-rich membrane protein [uncultured Oscillibacter sp.]
MPAVLGNIIVLTVLAVAVGLAVRSLWKSRKSGGGCSGDCGNCGSCGGCRHN